MNMKGIGCVLLILGTSIGAGMMALPIAMAGAHLSVTVVVMVVSWAAMTLGALSILEVNLWLEPGTNLISMSGQTLGRFAQALAWVFYLLLLYSLLCAYLSGVGDILQHLLMQLDVNISRSLGTVLALVVLGSVVYLGLGSVDKVNRILMLSKLLLFVLLVVVITSHFNMTLVPQGHYSLTSNMLLVVLTSFGFAIIVPSLREYLASDVKRLFKVLIVGSLLPLLIYLIWVLVVQGVVPRSGAHGLLAIARSSSVNSMLMARISAVAGAPWLAVAAKLFVSICVLTSFLGVSICLIDFIADGLKLKKKGRSAVTIYSIAYLPPLLIVIMWPGIFIQALSYAGVCCVVILILLPLMMLYVGRYRQARQGAVIVGGGRAVLWAGMLFGCLVLVVFVLQLCGVAL